MPSSPDVQLHGSLFFPDVVRGNYERITVDITGLSSGDLRFSDISAELHGVHIALGPLVTGSVPGIPIDSSIDHVTLGYDDLNRYLASQGKPITVDRGRSGSLRLTGRVTAFGSTFAVSGGVAVTVADDGLHASPVELETGQRALDSISRALLQNRLSFVVPTAPLPFGRHRRPDVGREHRQHGTNPHRASPDGLGGAAPGSARPRAGQRGDGSPVENRPPARPPAHHPGRRDDFEVVGAAPSTPPRSRPAPGLTQPRGGAEESPARSPVPQRCPSRVGPARAVHTSARMRR